MNTSPIDYIRNIINTVHTFSKKIYFSYFDENYKLTRGSKYFKNVHWVTLKNIEDKKFYDEKYKNHITQGNMGNCWFIGVLNAINHKNNIDKVIDVNQDINSKYFNFSFYKNTYFDICLKYLFGFKRKKNIKVDNKLLYNDNEKVHATINDNNMWIEYLEKAYGKFNNKYDNMDGEYISIFNIFKTPKNTASKAFYDLLGYATIEIKSFMLTQNSIKKILEINNTNNNIYIVNSFYNDRPIKFNIIGCHLYTVISYNKDKDEIILDNQHGEYVTLKFYDFISESQNFYISGENKDLQKVLSVMEKRYF